MMSRGEQSAPAADAVPLDPSHGADPVPAGASLATRRTLAPGDGSLIDHTEPFARQSNTTEPLESVVCFATPSAVQFIIIVHLYKYPLTQADKSVLQLEELGIWMGSEVAFIDWNIRSGADRRIVIAVNGPDRSSSTRNTTNTQRTNESCEERSRQLDKRVGLRRVI